MKTLHKNKLLFVLLSFYGVFFTVFIALPTWALDESGSSVIKKNENPGKVNYQRYSNMAELITCICDEAGEVFRNFYAPEAVEVEPFAVVSDYRVNKMSMLGITLADQMTAIINREPTTRYTTSNKYPQTMEGVIEEMDGYLRIRISGRNLLGEGRSYVVNVEMSEPLYRFLHSYVESHQKN